MPLMCTFASASVRAFRSSSAPKVETLIDRTIGTNIGDMINGGGLAAAFDGNTNQVHSSGAYKDTAHTAYIGKTYGAGKIFSKAVIWSSNNYGFSYDDTSTMEIKIYGKNGTPTNGTDGTLLGTTGAFADGSTLTSKTITSTDLVNAYTSIWAYIDATTASPSLYQFVSELELWELL